MKPSIASQGSEHGSEPKASKRRRRERIQTLLSPVKKIFPKKRNLACFAIGVMAYLRGPSLLSREVDPNVAHAGITVKVSGVRFEAKVKDIAPLIPIRTKSSNTEAAPVVAPIKKTITEAGISDKAKREIEKFMEPVPALAQKVSRKDLTKLVTSTPGTFVIAAGSGILAGVFARRKVDEEDAGNSAMAEKYVQDMLASPLEEPVEVEDMGTYPVESSPVEDISDNQSEDAEASDAEGEVEGENEDEAEPEAEAETSASKTDEPATTPMIEEETATGDEPIIEPIAERGASIDGTEETYFEGGSTGIESGNQEASDDGDEPPTPQQQPPPSPQIRQSSNDSEFQ